MKKPWNSQRILRLFALNPAYVCEISVLFFVFRCTLAWSTVLLFSSLPVFNFSNRNNKSEPMTNRQKVRIILFWWTRRGSNPRPLGCEPNALPAELRAHVVDLITIPQQGKIVKLVLKKVRRCCSAWKSGRRTLGKRDPGSRQRPLSCLPGQEVRKQNTHDPQRHRPSVQRSFYNKSITIKQRQFMACGLQKSAYIDRRIIFAYNNNVYMIK